MLKQTPVLPLLANVRKSTERNDEIFKFTFHAFAYFSEKLRFVQPMRFEKLDRRPLAGISTFFFACPSEDRDLPNVDPICRRRFPALRAVCATIVEAVAVEM